MKIKSIEIINFRSIKHDTIECLDFNSFVGSNGSGKSTVLNALNVFFGEINSFSKDDFHKKNTKENIEIKVVFGDLSDEAREEFRHYVRADRLVIVAEISEDESGNFKRVIHGERLIFPPFKKFFEAPSAAERGKVFKEFRTRYPKIDDASTDAARKEALNTYEENLGDDEKELTRSGAEFFGISKGVHKLQRHISWVYVPAVKDAASESEEAKSSHLGRLIQHTIRSGMDYEKDIDKIRGDALGAYEKLLDAQQSHLTTLQERLSSRLQNAVTAEADLSLAWKNDDKSVSVQDPVAQVLLSDRGFVGEVDKFGHGLQRSFLLVILQELMASDSDVSPTLILGCEEPELYQHPPQAKHLAAILKELSSGDAQIFVTTHSPYFVDVDHYEGIKMFRNSNGAAKTTKSSFGSILTGYNEAFDRPIRNDQQAKTKLAIHTQPKFNEVFFTDKVVIVEGISDQACIEAYLRLSNRKAEFQKSGTSILVCEGKSSLALMLLIAKDFEIPFHVVIDCDANSDEQYHTQHIKDNDAILSLAGHAPLGAFPREHITKTNLTAWLNDIEDVLNQEYSEEYEECHQAGRDAVGQLKSSKKNPLYISAAMDAAWEKGKRFPTISQLITAILE